MSCLRRRNSSMDVGTFDSILQSVSGTQFQEPASQPSFPRTSFPGPRPSDDLPAGETNPHQAPIGATDPSRPTVVPVYRVRRTSHSNTPDTRSRHMLTDTGQTSSAMPSQTATPALRLDVDRDCASNHHIQMSANHLLSMRNRTWIISRRVAGKPLEAITNPWQGGIPRCAGAQCRCAAGGWDPWTPQSWDSCPRWHQKRQTHAGRYRHPASGR